MKEHLTTDQKVSGLNPDAGQSGCRCGVITFTIPANATFSVQISGDKNNPGDNYTIQGSATTTKTTDVLVPKS
jgi:hypothetical protein